MSSTVLFDAASNSNMFKLCPLLNATQDSHALQHSKSEVMFVQLMVFAKILAHVVLPTPRGPVKRKA
jgi:hypothetical protein